MHDGAMDRAMMWGMELWGVLVLLLLVLAIAALIKLFFTLPTPLRAFALHSDRNSQVIDQKF